MHTRNQLPRIRRPGPRGEAVFWLAGLVAVASADPTAPSWINLCPLKALGFSFCPGCGLGHAVAFLARGEFAAAIHTHPFAPFAVGLILHHVAKLLRAPNVWRHGRLRTQTWTGARPALLPHETDR